MDGIRAESRIQAELAAAMKGFDALLCPASAIPALEADASHLTALSWMAHRWSTTGRRAAPGAGCLSRGAGLWLASDRSSEGEALPGNDEHCRGDAGKDSAGQNLMVTHRPVGLGGPLAGFYDGDDVAAAVLACSSCTT
ncbi:hypothetical protein [Paenarthrobacter sp. PH39-S1]|uniref:hypothetical protein n=1 Tax=Paenarthrobacter sp. PH39-S1 TaxID=3046204 RepID=UPI0024B8BEEB|nr:hypothetical protein [Paenarthrobacter sp. PH39-S1]MDJ0355679.1 hypothetical protein [Paenarthrobacter sp. PH39-S1]